MSRDDVERAYQTPEEEAEDQVAVETTNGSSGASKPSKLSRETDSDG